MTAPVQLLTAEQACEKLACSRRTLDRLIAAGRLKATRLGDGRTSPVKIHPRELADLIERRTKRAKR